MVSQRETALAEALGALIALLEITARGCGHTRPRELCAICKLGARRALNEARKAMATEGEGR